MILESVLWLPSMFPGTLSDFMKEERKSMNALGGRGIWPASRFFAWEGLAAAAVTASVAVAEMRGVSSSDISSKRGLGSGIASVGPRDQSGLYGMVEKSASNEYGEDIIGIVIIRGGGGRSTRGGISSVGKKRGEGRNGVGVEIERWTRTESKGVTIVWHVDECVEDKLRHG